MADHGFTNAVAVGDARDELGFAQLFQAEIVSRSEVGDLLTGVPE